MQVLLYHYANRTLSRAGPHHVVAEAEDRHDDRAERRSWGAQRTSRFFRKLAELSYQTSYSHRGRYYTLADIPQYDAWGLWSYRSVWFSRRGTLLATAEALVQEADAGFFVAELEGVLNVEVKGALLRLVRQQKLARASFAGRYLYCSPDTATRDAQLTARRVRDATTPLGGRLPHVDVLPDELKASIVLFFSLLDEQQRRLYAGLESLKMGHGGDQAIADLLGLDAGDRGPRAAPPPGPRCDCRACPPGWRRTPTGGKKNASGHRTHRRADDARDGGRPHVRVEMDPKDHREDRRRAAVAWHQRGPTHRGQAAHAVGVLLARQSEETLHWLAGTAE